jgi:transposase
MLRHNIETLDLEHLASTIEKWQQQVIDAVLTGYSNAKAEAHNRTDADAASRR